MSMFYPDVWANYKTRNTF